MFFTIRHEQYYFNHITLSIIFQVLERLNLFTMVNTPAEAVQAVKETRPPQ